MLKVVLYSNVLLTCGVEGGFPYLMSNKGHDQEEPTNILVFINVADYLDCIELKLSASVATKVLKLFDMESDEHLSYEYTHFLLWAVEENSTDESH